MVTRPCINYRKLPGATPEAERQALANVYKLVLDAAAAKKKAAEGSSGVDSGKGQGDDPASRILHDRR
jgi:hypothetical protein